MHPITLRIATELEVKSNQVNAAISLLDEGATVPFISRYRKELTGGLDDSQMRLLEDRLGYHRDFEERRLSILNSIRNQGKLTEQLEASINQAESKSRLEDLYLPFKPKRRNKALIAREAGLQALADTLFLRKGSSPNDLAKAFINPSKGIESVDLALQGARSILIEEISENAELLTKLRKFIWQRGFIRSSLIKGKEHEGAKFQDYFDFSEQIHKIPSHRLLALFRARNEGIVNLELTTALEDSISEPAEQLLYDHLNLSMSSHPIDQWMLITAKQTWKIKLKLHINLELFKTARLNAEDDAIGVFGSNLKDLLLAAPAGEQITMGVDPGIRTGIKIAIIDTTGKLIATDTLYPHPPKKQWRESQQVLLKLCKKHRVTLVSIGNGTGSRETEKLINELIKDAKLTGIDTALVSEAGASIYSASEFASKEFPNLDVTLRGAVSIARRLQDPLSELVKIDPKSIGVGQYQHDVNQSLLNRRLDAIVEDCVNAVGVDVNIASAPLLSRISGISPTLAENIVSYRDEHGSFQNRKLLKKVPRFGEKTFEQAAGFLRISNGSQALDNSSVHPEAYPLISRMLNDLNVNVEQLIANKPLISKLDSNQYIDENFGLPTVMDILQELEKPGRDPRPEFRTAKLTEGIDSIKDLSVGMKLEGTVSNVTNFGAFVDLGVHQDGLLHISELSDSYVKDPRDIVKTGDIVNVRVTQLDLPRKRIGLSMKSENTQGQQQDSTKQKNKPVKKQATTHHTVQKNIGAFAGALSQALIKKHKN